MPVTPPSEAPLPSSTPVPPEQLPVVETNIPRGVCVERNVHGIPPANGAYPPFATIRNSRADVWGKQRPRFVHGRRIVCADVRRLSEKEREFWKQRWPDFDLVNAMAQQPNENFRARHRANINNYSINMSVRVMDGLQAMRDEIGQPIVVISAYRSPNRNRVVSETGSHGPHTFGAFDIWHGGDILMRQKLIVAAYKAGFRGIGIGPNVIHIDMGKPGKWEPRGWGYGDTNYLEILDMAHINYNFADKRACAEILVAQDIPS